MFGKLSLSAIPFDVPIIMITVAAVMLLGLGLLAAITWYGEWQVLLTYWPTARAPDASHRLPVAVSRRGLACRPLRHWPNSGTAPGWVWNSTAGACRSRVWERC